MNNEPTNKPEPHYGKVIIPTKYVPAWMALSDETHFAFNEGLHHAAPPRYETNIGSSTAIFEYSKDESDYDVWTLTEWYLSNDAARLPGDKRGIWE